MEPLEFLKAIESRDNFEEYTPLQMALLVNDMKMVKILLESNADPNQFFHHGNLKGSSLLHFALTSRSCAMVILLLAYGADVFAISPKKLPPIYFVIRYNRFPVIHYLLEHKISPDTLISKDCSLLTYAVEQEKIIIVRCILAHRPSINLYHNQQAVAKAICLRSGHSRELVRMLYGYGFKLHQADITYELILAAIDNGHSEAVQDLLQLGIDPNFEVISQSRKGGTLLHRAIKIEDANIVRLLLTYGANPHLRDDDGNTPMLIAARKNNLCIIQHLLNFGAYVTDVNKHNFTVLHYAIMEHADWLQNHLNWHVNNIKTTIVKLFISLGAKIDTKTTIGHSCPLHFAAEVGVPGVVQVLLAHGARVDEVDIKNMTPLEISQNQIVSLNIRMNSNDNLEGNVPEMVSILKLATFRSLQHHVYQLDQIGLPVGPRTLVENSNDILKLDKDFSKIIDNEIKLIKKTKISNSFITLYHFLRSSDEQAAKIIRNDDILEDLKMKVQFPSRFPEYAPFFEKKLTVAVTKKKENSIMFRLMKFFIEEKKLPSLPNECIENIITFLNDKDKRMIIYHFAHYSK